MASSRNVGVAGVNGGGLCNEVTATVTGSIFTDNSTQSGGGIAGWGPSLTITGATVTDNTASGNGGGIAYWGQQLTVSGCTVSGNAAGSQGGGIGA